MTISDKLLGFALVAVAGLIFVYYTVWVLILVSPAILMCTAYFFLSYTVVLHSVAAYNFNQCEEKFKFQTFEELYDRYDTYFIIQTMSFYAKYFYV